MRRVHWFVIHDALLRRCQQFYVLARGFLVPSDAQLSPHQNGIFIPKTSPCSRFFLASNDCDCFASGREVCVLLPTSLCTCVLQATIRSDDDQRKCVRMHLQQGQGSVRKRMWHIPTTGGVLQDLSPSVLPS